jgi:monovalent cation/hydrogen antiporter
VHDIEVVVALVVLVAAVSGLARRLELPGPVLLVIAGLVLGVLPGVPDVAVNPNLVSALVLPPLLYAAALELPAREVRANLGVIAVLSLGLVVAEVFVLGLLAHLVVPGVSLHVGIVLGAILAATDPIAVTALARRLPLPRRLVVIAQSESLFNDATSLVAYRVAVAAVVVGQQFRAWDPVFRFVLVAGGGGLIGLALGALIGGLRPRLADPVLENAVALLTPFVAFLLAESAGTSGVTAVVACGMWLSARAGAASSSSSRLQESAVWNVVVFLLEGTVFGLIGLQLPTVVRALGNRPFQTITVGVLVMTVGVILVRFAGVFLAVYIRPPGRNRPREPAPPWQYPAVLAWTGTRGVVALAASLSLPLVTHRGGPFPKRDELIAITAFVIVLTVVLQGLTLGPVVARLGVRADHSGERREEALARHRAAQAALTQLEELLDVERAPQAVVDQLRRGLEDQLDRSRRRLDSRPERYGETSASYGRLRRRLIEAERAEITRLRDTGEISDTVMRRVHHSLDLEESALGGGQA